MTKQIKNLEKENLIFARPVRRRPRSARRSPDSWSQPELTADAILPVRSRRSPPMLFSLVAAAAHRRLERADWVAATGGLWSTLEQRELWGGAAGSSRLFIYLTISNFFEKKKKNRPRFATVLLKADYKSGRVF
nr:hypothetical protein Iba_chr06bCG17790 [Ipomoea batatas]